MLKKGLGARLVLLACLAATSLAAAPGDAQLADAVMRSDREAIRTLLQQKADVNATQVDGMTALHWATRQNDLETVQALLKAGAKVDRATRYGVTPIYLASLLTMPGSVSSSVSQKPSIERTWRQSARRSRSLRSSS